MSQDEPRIYEYPMNLGVNAPLTPRVEIPLTPEAKADMIQSAKESYGPSPVEKAVRFLMTFEEWLAEHSMRSI